MKHGGLLLAVWGVPYGVILGEVRGVACQVIDTAGPSLAGVVLVDLWLAAQAEAANLVPGNCSDWNTASVSVQNNQRHVQFLTCFGSAALLSPRWRPRSRLVFHIVKHNFVAAAGVRGFCASTDVCRTRSCGYPYGESGLSGRRFRSL